MNRAYPSSMQKRLLPIVALGAFIALALVCNGFAFAYEQIADACHEPAFVAPDSHASDQTGSATKKAGDLNDSHCCHAHGVVAGVHAGSHRLAVDRDVSRRSPDASFHDLAPLAPPVPPPNA